MSVHELAQRARDRMDLEQLKMPIGFIRIVELIFALIAYVSLNGWDFDLKIVCNYTSGSSTTRVYSFGSLKLHQLVITKCDNATVTLFENSNGLGASFFSVVLVMSILFAAGTILFYLFSWAIYVSDDRLPMIDLAVTIILAFCWLIGTFCFSITAARVEDDTQRKNVLKLLNDVHYCDGAKECKAESYAMYSPLTVATIAGAACVLLFGANVWYVYKETANFRTRNTRNLEIRQDPYTLE